MPDDPMPTGASVPRSTAKEDEEFETTMRDNWSAIVQKVSQEQAKASKAAADDTYLEETWLCLALAATARLDPNRTEAEAAANYADVLLERFEGMRRKLRHRKGKI